MRINTYRLAITFAVIGIVALPAYTGSIRRLLLDDNRVYSEKAISKQTDFLRWNHTDAVDCGIDKYLSMPQMDVCSKGEAILKSGPSSYDFTALVAALRDMALGLVPAIFVLIGPPLVGGYVRWLTHVSDKNSN